MAERPRSPLESDAGNVPEELDEREDTGVIVHNDRVDNASKITALFERYKALKERTPSHEQVRQMVTDARTSIAASVVGKESFDTLRQAVAEAKPPSLWKVASGAAAFLLAIATIIWQASARVSDIALQNAMMKMQVDGLDASVKRLEASVQAAQSKIDQLLIHGGGKP